MLSSSEAIERNMISYNNNKRMARRKGRGRCGRKRSGASGSKKTRPRLEAPGSSSRFKTKSERGEGNEARRRPREEETRAGCAVWLCRAMVYCTLDDARRRVKRTGHRSTRPTRTRVVAREGERWTSFSQIESKSRFQAQIANVKHRARAHRYSCTGSTGIGTGIVGSTETFDRPP